MRAVTRCFGDRYKMHLYDYQRIDPTNPRQLASDEVLPNVNEPNHSSRSVALWFYTVGGFLVYASTRLMYDTEWDRYYHVYYPASMEYFDVLSLHYAQRLQALEGRYPKSWGEILPKASLTKAYRRWEAQKAAGDTKKGEEELVDSIIATVIDADSIPEKLLGAGSEE